MMRRSLVLPLMLLFPAPALAQDLAPPPPMGPNGPGQPGQQQQAPPGSTEEQLQQAEKEDSGRNFELVYVVADAGGSYISMDSFSSTKLALQKTNNAGAMFGLGAGVRLLIFTLGARARYHSAFNLWQLNGEFGLHLPAGKFDPYFALHGGYAFTGDLDAQTVSSPTSATVHGFNGGASLGIDYYLSSLFSLGLDGTADFLFLQRPPAPLPATINGVPTSQIPQAQLDQLKSEPIYQNSGSSVGFGGSLSLHMGFHFGF
jgi:hypothetical protein